MSSGLELTRLAGARELGILLLRYEFQGNCNLLDLLLR